MSLMWWLFWCWFWQSGVSYLLMLLTFLAIIIILATHPRK